MASTLRRTLPILAGVAFGLLLGLLLGRPDPTPSEGGAGYARAVARAAPAVVNVYTERAVAPRTHPYCVLPRFREFCEQLPRRVEGSLGSGVIVRPDGHVLTNNHVIADADRIRVALADGREAPAEVVGTDPVTDLAVLRVDLPGLTVAEPAPGDALRVGDVVLAIGNPFGFEQTVSQGIVSALGRYDIFANPYEAFIQTDAAVNPGNSGGALVDVEGRLVGLNTLIFSRSGGYQGIGFAIPARLALEVLDELVARGEVVRGWLGVEVDLAAPAADGLTVAAVATDGPAERAGLRPGDVIRSVDGAPVESAREVVQRIAMLEPGQAVVLGVDRGDRSLTLTAEVGRRPSGS